MLTRVTLQDTTKDILDSYGAAQAIDTLHGVVSLARERHKKGESPKEVWRADLAPRAAVRARTIPLLQRERDRMQAVLQEVSLVSYAVSSMARCLSYLVGRRQHAVGGEKRSSTG